MRWLFLLVSAWLAGNLQAAAYAQLPAQDPPRVHELPSQMCRNYFFVPITLSDQPDRPQDRTLWFLYDTGASSSFADPDSLARVTAQSFDTGQRVNIREATLGPLTYNRLPVRVQELDHLSMALGREIDGILAYDALGDFLVTLDYQTGQIRLEAGQLPPPDGISVFDTDGRDSRPWLDIEFPGRTRRMLIDSGAGGTVLAVNRLHRYPTQSEPRPTGASMRLNRVETRDGARLDGVARLGPHALTAPTLQSTPGTELIGGQVMRHFRWTFDADRERVRIERVTQTEIGFDPVISHGLVLRGDGNGMRVTAVLDNTPAAAAGVREGDLITHFNGLEMRDRDCNPDGTREELVITLVRDGTVMDVPLALYPLVE
ncbi:PDZ domain-containing protein [Maricaulis parjimensis]|uniref:PDZ domain-containing protein n=1 Tax=Maricaulis parjimensis TaxID=144023 RepID=UPI0019394476|nr:PDZ domain-containing protein [Maricaulis parjimensis]